MPYQVQLVHSARMCRVHTSERILFSYDSLTIYLINDGNFLIIHTMMFGISWVNMKWLLFDNIPFNETPVGWFEFAECWSETLITICVLFWAWFSWKKIHKIAGTKIQLSGLNAIFSLSTERSKCFNGHKIFAYFAPCTFTWSATTSLLFKRCYFRSPKSVYQNFSSSTSNNWNLFQSLSIFLV